LAPAGEVGYVSANAFLDAFAAWRKKDYPFITSVNWSPWGEIGMTAVSARYKQRRPKFEPPQFKSTKISNHHFFDEYLTDGKGLEIFVSHFSPSKNWFLDEHRLNGKAIFPGSASIELIRAALNFRQPNRQFLEIKDVDFLQPLTAKDGETKEVRTILKSKGNNRFEFTVISRLDTDLDKWQEHFRGFCSVISQQKIKYYNLREIKNRCSQRFDDNQVQKRTVFQYGPRWKNLQEIYFGSNQALAKLALPKKFRGDLKRYVCHPALIDMAVSFLVRVLAKELIKKEAHETYIPINYRFLKINVPKLPAQLFVHSKYLYDSNDLKQGLLKFNVVLMDSRGQELLKFEKFALKKINVNRFTSKSLETKTQDFFLGSAPVVFSDSDRVLLTPLEGLEAFKRIIFRGQSPQIAVSPVDFFSHRQGRKEKAVNRPSPETYSVETDLEQKIIQIWQQQFGHRSINPKDDFFEMGGSSLDAIAINARLKEYLNIDIPLAAIFEHSTPRNLANFINKGQKAAKTKPISGLNKVKK
jgi:acyl carrier protein